MMLEVQREREEFERNSRIRREWLEKESAATDAEREKGLAHKTMLQTSIADRADARKQVRWTSCDERGWFLVACGAVW